MNHRACFRCVLFSLLFAAGAGTRAQEGGVYGFTSPLDTLFSSDVVVARIGPSVVTVREFMITSTFGPAFPKRQPETRRRILGYMINEKLLALGAAHHADDPRVRSNLEALEGDMATEELYRDDVLSRVQVSPEEIADAVRQNTTTLSLRWIFKKERDGAAAVMRDLRQGHSFDALYRQDLAAGNIPDDDRRMTATLFELRRRNAPLAVLAATLPVGRHSDPVEGPDGFYILLVDSLNRSMVTTQSEEVRLRSDAHRALRTMKADSLSDVYVRRKMLDAQPVIQRPVFDLLRAYLGSRILSSERFTAFGLTNALPKADSGYMYIDRFGARTLVKLHSGAVTLGDFLRWYRLREHSMTFRNDSPQGFFLSVEDVVWRMVRDRILVKAALTRGLHRRPSVAAQQRWWKEKLLYQVAMDSIKRTIGWSDSTLEAYYAGHARSFRDSSGASRPFAAVKDDVLREWYDLELKARTLHALNRCMKDFPVTINEQALNALPMDAENEPRAIEVYAVKKGGTFPRPAFPTIDRSWQTWQ